jgi:hypothetical protein
MLLELLLLAAAPQCIPRYQLPPEVTEEHIMFDKEGDRWVIIINKGTGLQTLGYITTKEQFCPVAEGKPKARKL